VPGETSRDSAAGAVDPRQFGPRNPEARRWVENLSESTIEPPASFDPNISPLDWLLTAAGSYGSRRALVRDLGRLMVERGFPLFRASCFVRTLHPQTSGRSVIWYRDLEEPTALRVMRGMESTPAFKNSPMPVIFEGAMGIRRRLDHPDEQNDFPVLDDLRREGATDYVAMPIHFSDGNINFATWTADRPGGFSTEELSEIYHLMPAFSMRMEILERRDLTRQLLEVYLGRETGHRVLDGQIIRGEARGIRAAVWFSDIRNFTELSDRLPRDAVIELLDSFFELAVQAVEERGGEVLKFLGDGMLAIFPAEEEGDAAACRNALAAARDTVKMMDVMNKRRRKHGKDIVDFGIALHLGEVGYGNIGGAERLDFTVIGPAVNLASRIEGLTRICGCRLLASADFAGCIDETLHDMGSHEVKGVDRPVQVFAPSDLLPGDPLPGDPLPDTPL